MGRYIKREDAVFAACKVLDKFGGCKMGPLCPDVGCSEVRDIIDTFQMIEIPKQHGRLSDGDALKMMWDDEIAFLLEKGIEYLDYHVDTLSSDFKRDVDKMPTIIPAEEGE